MEFVTWKAADPGVAGVESPPRSKKVKQGTKVGGFWPPGMGFFGRKNLKKLKKYPEFCGNTDQILIRLYDVLYRLCISTAVLCWYIIKTLQMEIYVGMGLFVQAFLHVFTLEHSFRDLCQNSFVIAPVTRDLKVK